MVAPAISFFSSIVLHLLTLCIQRMVPPTFRTLDSLPMNQLGETSAELLLVCWRHIALRLCSECVGCVTGTPVTADAGEADQAPGQ
jgi:hypothetical protein